MWKRLFSRGKSHQQTKQSSVLYGLVFGTIMLCPAILVFILSNSLTLFSEILRNAGLTLALLFSWLTLRRVAKGKTNTYNYGYGKLENLSNLVIAVFMIIAIATIIYQTIVRLQTPVALSQFGVGMGIVFSTLASLGTTWLWWNAYKTAKREPSVVLESVLRLYRFKALSNICVLSSFILSFVLRNYPWSIYIDPAGSIVLLGFLVYITYGIISKSVDDLLDRTLEESLQLVVLRVLAEHFDSYLAIHGVRSRRSGSNVYIELFLEFDPDLKMVTVQNAMDEMKHDLEKKIVGSRIMIMATTSPPT
jgi:ferrous-iron efflux pump FieF